jgi:hypothetical protein
MRIVATTKATPDGQWRGLDLSAGGGFSPTGHAPDRLKSRRRVMPHRWADEGKEVKHAFLVEGWTQRWHGFLDSGYRICCGQPVHRYLEADVGGSG